MSDPIREYSNAINEYDKTYSVIREYGTITADLGRFLNNKPYDIGVSNSGAGLPAEMAMVEKQFTLNANDWPTAKQIAEALANLYEKRKLVNNLWSSLSPTDKNLVNPPNTK